MELAERLSDRDFEVLLVVNSHRFLTTGHIERFIFNGHATKLTAARISRRVIRRLEGLGLLEGLHRRVGGFRGGATSFVWRLTPLGRRLLAVREGLGEPRRVEERGEGFVRHHLATADIHLTLVEADRLRAFDLLDVQLEPESWRPFRGVGGEDRAIKPDLFAVVAGPDYETHLFIEADRGTESLNVIIRKCRQYEDYRATGIEQEGSGLFPRVLWAVPDEKRATKIRESIARARKLDPDLFIVTVMPEVAEVVTALTTENGGAA